ncbi:MAG: RNA polymerase subunit sigma-70 [Oscillospiraceae bacterium]|jgi:endogenous inhibitor of DNA gyrase (YacG/DUF329 family)|nr:RNA polymerase subunit sigma-70 [Oscillospiraceae bacterium]
MPRLQKDEIPRMRREGMSYAQIASVLGLSANTVKSYCQRNDLGGVAAIGAGSGACAHCGKPVNQTVGRKEKRFCSDTCRMAWWREHPERLNKKAVYKLVCAGCGKPFESYGNKNRKYCSHGCYIKDRFGDGR